ncbi:BTG-domain-containing protein [Hesseltinella vesiculosa]|uniref:BTG-domain-containing protein n=1 Tax=Hesseltinella vesiculosa TaxID=101127 RepID=A0A1X2GJ24_9FUNG|nr:BTG-domain-containing protein [Hesseltinella vesiculosa]
MHEEITEAMDFLGRLLESRLGAAAMTLFKNNLSTLLSDRFTNHWDVNEPCRGNAYRAISNFNGQLDPLLILAAQSSSIAPQIILAYLPQDFVLWIDPFTVSYRIGDHSNILNLYKNGKSMNKQRKLPSLSSTPIRISPPPSPAKGTTKIQQHLHTKKDQPQPHVASPPATPPPTNSTQQEVLVH